MMLSSPLQTSSSSTIDDRSLRAYLQHNAAWNLEESGPTDHLNLSANGNGEKFLNSSVHFPLEMRSSNLNQMVSSIVDENGEDYQARLMQTFGQHPMAWMNGGQTDQQMRHASQTRNIPSRQMKMHGSSFSESGHPRNIPDTCSTQLNPPKDLQVWIRAGDHTGVNPLVRNVTLQQFRQMIGLQRSSGLTTIHDRRNRHSNQLTSNIRLINAFKQQENKKFNQQWSQESNSNTILLQQQQMYSSMISNSSHDTGSMSNANLTSPPSNNQEMSYFRSSRRTGVANTLHIAIEKCYEQLNYIRDSYAETESKIGLQKSSSSMMDITNTNGLILSNNPSRVDRLVAEYHYEYNRIIRLHEQIQEVLNLQDVEATRQTLDEWLNTINIVRDRRQQEIDGATEKCCSDEKDVLQLAEALRILRITTRKVRTVLWYWLYWSTNSTINKIPFIARHQEHPFEGIYSSLNKEFFFLPQSDDQQSNLLKKQSLLANGNNKENECKE